MEMTLPQAVRAAYLPHPLTTDGRQVYAEPPKRNETLGGSLRRLGIEVDTHPHAVLVNGRSLGEAWAKYRLRKGDQILIRAVVRGGGGGGGNKVLRTVAMIALVVAAVYTGGAAAAAWGTAWGAAAQAGVMIAGSMLINAVLPPPMPTTGSIGAGASVQQSPTYSLSGARNRIRKYEPMPLVLGRHRIVPDMAGQPYTVFEGQDQYLYQAFHFGLQSDLQLSDFKIGDTLLSDYQGVTVYHAGVDGKLPAEFGNVDTESGREIAQADGWVTRTTAADCVGIGVDIQGVAYYARDDGGIDNRTISYEIQYRATGTSGAWLTFAGGSFVLVGDSVNVTRQSIYSAVARGQYDVRIRKTSEDVDTTRDKRQFALAQLRTHQFDGADYTGQRRVGIKIKASSQLNGALDELSAVAQHTVPVWTGSAWASQVSQNPAWLLLYFLRGGIINGRRAWGAGLPDGRIDIDSIKRFAAWCDRKALTCSLVLDRQSSIKAVAEQIARCGRAQLTWQSGRYGVVWDDDSLPDV
ncbi:MAG: TipJ family phage tail tip protein, partial [Vogesella sp.]|uniref:TipJ family phage tail tip protein n=1 Tax=Vogesella sp. TaxID=1904252 RepID=UPI003F3D218E